MDCFKSSNKSEMQDITVDRQACESQSQKHYKSRNTNLNPKCSSLNKNGMQYKIADRQAWESQSQKLILELQKDQPESKMLQAFNNFVPW